MVVKSLLPGLLWWERITTFESSSSLRVVRWLLNLLSSRIIPFGSMGEFKSSLHKIVFPLRFMSSMVR